MSDLAQVRDYSRALDNLDLSPPPNSDAVDGGGQAGRPAVSPPPAQALPAPTSAPIAVPPPAVNPTVGPTSTALAPPPPPIGGTLTPPADAAPAASKPSAQPQQTRLVTDPNDPAYGFQAPHGKGPPPPGDADQGPLEKRYQVGLRVLSEGPAKSTGTPGPGALPDTGPPGQVYKPPIPMKGINWFAHNRPDDYNMINEIATKWGTTAHRLLRHMEIESSFGKNVHGAAGEEGPYQFMPGTRRDVQNQFFKGREMNPFNLRDATELAAAHIWDLDKDFGQDTPTSVAAYNGGKKGRNSEQAQAYAKNKFFEAKYDLTFDGRPGGSGGGAGPGGETGNRMTARGLYEAGRQGGPDETLRYIINNGSGGLSMSDAWQQAQRSAMYAFLLKGDIDGANKAMDFITQQAFQGSNMYLMEAASRLQAGDGIGAAKAMAKSHAFFPDGSMGQFHSNGRDVYGVPIDESTGQPVGPRTQITPEVIQGMLKTTQNPMTWQKQLLDNQKSLAEIRHKNALAAHELQKPAIEAGKERRLGVEHQQKYEQQERHWQATQAGSAADRAQRAQNARAMDIRHQETLEQQWEMQSRTLTGQDKRDAENRAQQARNHADLLKQQDRTATAAENRAVQADRHHLETLNAREHEAAANRAAAANRGFTPQEKMTLSEKAWEAEPVPETHANDPAYVERRSQATQGILGSNPPGSIALATIKSMTNRLLGGELELRPTDDGYGVVDPKQPDRKLANMDVENGQRFLGKWHPRNPRAGTGEAPPQLLAPAAPGGPAQAIPAPRAPPPPSTGTPERPRMTGAGPVVDAPPTGQTQPPPWFVGTAQQWWERQNRPPTGPVPQNITIDPNRPALNRPQ